jgi:hypothetical protein
MSSLKRSEDSPFRSRALESCWLRRALREEFAFPEMVTGPRDLDPLAREAARRFSEISIMRFIMQRNSGGG